MKVKISKDYSIWETIRVDDWDNEKWSSITKPANYHQWETVDVTFDELKDLIENGTAILINC